MCNVSLFLYMVVLACFSRTCVTLVCCNPLLARPRPSQHTSRKHPCVYQAPVCVSACMCVCVCVCACVFLRVCHTHPCVCVCVPGPRQECRNQPSGRASRSQPRPASPRPAAACSLKAVTCAPTSSFGHTHTHTHTTTTTPPRQARAHKHPNIRTPRQRQCYIWRGETQRECAGRCKAAQRSVMLLSCRDDGLAAAPRRLGHRAPARERAAETAAPGGACPAAPHTCPV